MISDFLSNRGEDLCMRESIDENCPEGASGSATPWKSRGFKIWEKVKSHTVLNQGSKEPIGQVAWWSWSRNLGAISLLDAFGQLAWKRKSDECALHICTLCVKAGNKNRRSERKSSRMHTCDVTFHAKDFAHAVLVLAGENKVKCCLIGSRVYHKM